MSAQTIAIRGVTILYSNQSIYIQYVRIQFNSYKYRFYLPSCMEYKYRFSQPANQLSIYLWIAQAANYPSCHVILWITSSTARTRQSSRIVRVAVGTNKVQHKVSSGVANFLWHGSRQVIAVQFENL